MTVLNDILNRGKTKFDEPYESLSLDEKVLLYCYFNMKKHFFTSVAVFQKLWKSLSQILTNKAYSITFIDLGCGPLTSGLALAEIYLNETKAALCFNYIGIDISEAMIRKAKEFAESDLFDTKSIFQFYPSWNDIPTSTLDNLAGKNNPFFLNASYLFANLSEDDVDDLVRFAQRLITNYKNVHFVFQNPDRVDRNTNWERFKNQLRFKEIDKKVEQIIYKTSKSALREPGSEDVYYEILTLMP
jgi:DNA replication ATP-dependent helicase Dna2